MREGCCLLLLLLCCAGCIQSFGIFSRPNPFSNIRPPPKKQGALKLCPPGGSSFIDAFNLICPMRKRRSVDEPIGREKRSSSMERVMEMCCSFGCDFKDILVSLLIKAKRFSLCAIHSHDEQEEDLHPLCIHLPLLVH